MPCFSAVVRTKVLKVEPGCLCPWAARLNWLWS